MISVFELFSIGIGPSSSHTVGPMRATRDFLLKSAPLDTIFRLEAILYGSLAFTGKGHGTDKAVIAGLLGEQPETIDPDQVKPYYDKTVKSKHITLLGVHEIAFSPEKDIVFNYKDVFDFHPNGIRFITYDKNNKVIRNELYFSIGGGFIVNEKETSKHQSTIKSKVEFPFSSAEELMAHCKKHKMTIPEIMLRNEKTWRKEKEIIDGLQHIANVMENCIDKGCRSTESFLSGPLHVRRRAPQLYNKLIAIGEPNAQHPQTMNWLNTYAMAVNEENAAGKRVVTAPTNGAAGIIPAVLNYYKYFCREATKEGVINYLLTAGAMGILYKKNASISGAEMGCQGEVGVACSMAAGGLAAALGGSILQIENAAEIGMEHNLGLTCDPVGGLVQIPCIERNAMGAVKAVNAARLALAEDGEHKVSLDMVIQTMREIGQNMNSIYKETSKGGLAVAVNVIEC